MLIPKFATRVYQNVSKCLAYVNRKYFYILLHYYKTIRGESHESSSESSGNIFSSRNICGTSHESHELCSRLCIPLFCCVLIYLLMYSRDKFTYILHGYFTDTWDVGEEIPKYMGETNWAKPKHNVRSMILRTHQGPFYCHGSRVITERISDHMPSKLWEDIT